MHFFKRSENLLFKHFTKFSIISLLLVACFTLSVFADATGKVTGSSVNLRKKPGTSAEVLTTLKEDTELVITGESEDGKWYKVNYENYTGYMVKLYIDAIIDGVVKGAQAVNVRKGPGKDNERIETLNENTKIKILSEKDDWYQIKYGSIEGYMSKEFVSAVFSSEDATTVVETKVTSATESTSNDTLGNGYITASVLNFRSSKSTSSTSNIISKIAQDTKISVNYEENGWYNINYSNKTGWVSKDYVSLEKDGGKPSVNSAMTSKQREVVAYAKEYLGVKYVYGGKSPKGFDCAGFTQYVYKKFDVSIPGGATSQSKYGKTISKSELQAGDLIFFKSPSFSTPIGHVGIYIGDGEFIHAASPGKNVRIDSLDDNYYDKYYVTARRLLSE